MIIFLDISEVVFDKRIKCMELKSSDAIEFVNSVNNFTVYAGRLIFQLPWWKIYPTDDWKEFVKASKYVFKSVYNLVICIKNCFKHIKKTVKLPNI